MNKHKTHCLIVFLFYYLSEENLTGGKGVFFELFFSKDPFWFVIGRLLGTYCLFRMIIN